MGLKENHPELYEKAKAYEKVDDATGEHFTWSDTESLSELEDPERMEEIMQQAAKRRERLKQQMSNRPLMEVFYEDEVRDLEDDGKGCNICHL